MSKSEMQMNIRPLLSLVCKRFFGDFTGMKLSVITSLLGKLDAEQKEVITISPCNKGTARSSFKEEYQ